MDILRMPKDILDDLEIAQLLTIALDAGKAIMEIYDQEDRDITYKSDDSPLTRADQAANEIICNGLQSLTNVLPIISEENKAIPYEQRKEFDYCWMVDPLDGTKEFIKRNGEFTVNIALIYKQRSIAGFVYAPALDELYYAVEGKGAFEVIKGEHVPLEAQSFRMNATGLKVVGSRSHQNDETRQYLNQLSDPDIVPKGSSLKFLIIAKGSADLYPRLAPTMEWDTAAADIVLREAGGL
ncbi:unnamed protein product, partial [Cyprideis torosa]